MNVDVYVLCYNEMELAPFAVQYWKRYATNVYVYDNGSTDGTIEYLSQFPFIHMRHFDSDGINDGVYIHLKNNIWKDSIGKADYVVVGDFDEFIYSDDLIKELEYMRDNGMTMCRPVWYDLVGDSFPVYDDSKYFHDIIKYGVLSNGPKVLIFDPNEINEINYFPGAHICNPVGIVKYYDKNLVYTYHACPIAKDWFINKEHKRYARLSNVNKRMGWGVHYGFSDEKISNDFDNMYNRKVNLI